jgi:hypothetical protein
MDCAPDRCVFLEGECRIAGLRIAGWLDGWMAGWLPGQTSTVWEALLAGAVLVLVTQ